MRTICIIGGGFTGTLTAVHLLQRATQPLHLYIINERESFNRGLAFHPYSEKHLLNVLTARMSAFKKDPGHFLDWVMQQPAYAGKDRQLVAQSFLPRELYGRYLQAIWQSTAPLRQKHRVEVVEATVAALQHGEAESVLTLSNGQRLCAHDTVLATGNFLPGNPRIAHTGFFTHENYFQNPWTEAAVSGTAAGLPVLIIGNGLTMVDTVIGLRENGFTGPVISLSPHGFGILPHRHIGMVYTRLVDELPADADLQTIVCLFNKHRKCLREFGVSAEPLIDSLRVYTQAIWQRLSGAEKRCFMARLRHLWGVARHRVPLHIYDWLQQQRLDGSLQVKAGRLLNLQADGEKVRVLYFDKKEKAQAALTVSRVINCTGPESNLLKVADSFLTQCLRDGTVVQDELRLGIRADTETFQVIDAKGQRLPNLFALGSLLRGELWESTAVNELRSQAEALAHCLLQQQPVTSPLREGVR